MASDGLGAGCWLYVGKGYAKLGLRRSWLMMTKGRLQKFKKTSYEAETLSAVVAGIDV